MSQWSGNLVIALLNSKGLRFRLIKHSKQQISKLSTLAQKRLKLESKSFEAGQRLNLEEEDKSNYRRETGTRHERFLDGKLPIKHERNRFFGFAKSLPPKFSATTDFAELAKLHCNKFVPFLAKLGSIVSVIGLLFLHC